MKTQKSLRLATISLLLGMGCYLQGCPTGADTSATASPSVSTSPIDSASPSVSVSPTDGASPMASPVDSASPIGTTAP